MTTMYDLGWGRSWFSGRGRVVVCTPIRSAETIISSVRRMCNSCVGCAIRAQDVLIKIFLRDGHKSSPVLMTMTQNEPDAVRVRAWRYGRAGWGWQDVTRLKYIGPCAHSICEPCHSDTFRSCCLLELVDGGVA